MRARAARPSTTTLGGLLRLDAGDATLQPNVFGSHVVVQTLLDQIVRYSGMSRCAWIASPFDQLAGQRRMDALVAAGARVRSVRVRSTTSLLSDARWLSELTAWHEVGDGWQFGAELRWSRARAAYPITTTTHAFVYRQQLQELYTRMLLLDLRPYDAVICTSRAARAAFRRILERAGDEFNEAHGTRLSYPGRIETIPLGVDTDEFRPAEPGDKEAFRARLGLPPDAFVLLWFGRLSFVDKADLFPLLGVFLDLVRAFPRRRLVLVLAGSSLVGAADMLGKYCGDLGVADRVRILSPFPGRDRRSIYAAADVFVCPGDNLQEAFGQTPLEAMACGIPQVVSDWDGYRDTVLEGETGFLIPTYWARCDRDVSRVPLLDWDLLDLAVLAQTLVVDLPRLREALEALVRDAGLRERLGRASRRRAVERFGWNVVVARYDALWRALSAEAAATTFRPDPRHANLRTHHWSAFRGYPTAALRDATPVRLTARGRQVLFGRAPLPAYFFSAAQSLDVEALGEALDRLRARGATLGSVAAAIVRPRWHKDHARRHVLWLLKQGFAAATVAAARRGT